MKTKVAIVDDDTSVLTALKHGLKEDRRVGMIREMTTGEEALEAIPRVRPHVVLMDIKMPGMTGIECTRELKAVMPSVPVVMFTARHDRQSVIEAFTAGASGYLVKPTPLSECCEAVMEAIQGGSPVSRPVVGTLIQTLYCAPIPCLGEAALLTPREREVMGLMIQGKLHKEISMALGISEQTVPSFVRRIYRKLGARSRSEAIAKYLRLTRDGGHPGHAVPSERDGGYPVMVSWHTASINAA